MNPEKHERLSSGVATVVEALAEGSDEDDDVYEVRIVPIGEGDVTTGQSGEPTHWDRETLLQAVEQGAFDGAKLLKGRPGEGHKEMLDQADPDEIIGGVDEWTYEEGVGPVGHGKVLDERMAKLIDHDLVDVSPDMFRLLDGYDEELGANTVDEILDVPYITVLDRGAAPSNTIDPATAEALGLPAGERGPDAGVEQLAEDVTVSRPDWDGISQDTWETPTLEGTFDGDIEVARESATVIRDDGESFSNDLSLFILNGEGELNINALESAWTLAPQTADVDDDLVDELRSMYESIAEDIMEDHDVEIDFIDEEQLSGLFTLRFRTFGEMIGDEFIDEAVESLESLDGITAARSSDNDDPELIAVIDREAVDSLDDLNDNIIDALEGTPFELHDGYDWVEEVAWEGLSASARDEPGGGDGQASDERAEPRVGPGSTTDPTSNMTEETELQEQLAEVKAERNQLEEETDDLEEQLSEKDEQIEEKEDRIEQLEEDIEDLEEDVQPLTEMLAELVAEDSMLAPDQVADRFEVGEMVEALAENSDAEEDASPVDVVREQLGEAPAPRGEGTDEEGGVEQLSPEQEAEANAMAREVMGAEDVVTAAEEQLSEREYAKRYLGADPAQCDSTQEFRRQVQAEAGGD
ncbi:putative prohead protease protein [Halobacterium phage ChaoS9]|uniref:Prohead protease protein n=1 Tax=Halobacterium phage ChaoS9 TaxID=2847105 RepID=A0A481V9D2_9CAUD|nr:putative prohead protease protein [Halobacterium phage ChaoS9]QBI90013.1 putative prohead protease protein [Halobacterium phage ChaoS9]